MIEMRKYLLLVVAAVLVASGVFFNLAIAQEKPGTPEACVRAFYNWYIKQDSQDHGFTPMSNEIYRYVSKGTVDLLRTEYRHNDLPGDADYFTNVQDYDEKDWLAHMAVHPAIMLGNVALVPVTLGRDAKATVKTNVVFLRKQDGVWKITKVDDTRDYK